ncbi:hypothetical protein I2485_14550 [Nesterenkonia sp. E16_7]|uniref:DUF6286 domain-containing protein n=1 Tax=unclassified Nesterenkonia TaxID=2629769 RepID=UPI001A9283AB|nr:MULTISPECIES: DUF6286 domain-containing protein [unclassified Nesterenkonia]MBO0596978.1 hypothetical protein [Nesterenkonia sp. E16_10]MBO0599867.1 hypothetical protein [Nesterenkonia sp. E16_7]
MSSPKIRRRPDRRIPALIVATVIVVLGALGLWWSLAAVTAQQPLAGLDGVEGLTWGAVPVVALAVLAGLIGLVLLVLALKPGRASVVEMKLDEFGPRRTTVITTRGLGRIAAAEADRTDGTVSSRVDARPGRVQVGVGTVAPSGREVQQVLAGRIQERYTGLGLRHSPRVTVRTTKKEKR